MTRTFDTPALRRSLLVALAVALAAPSGPAHADDSDTAGAMVGGSYFIFGADLGLHDGKAALAHGAERTAVDGFFGMLRMSTGLLMRVTRFGAEAGLEGTLGLGWISAGAFGGSEKAGLSADLAGGVVVVPYRSALVGGSAFKLAAGFGTDHDVDYLYASGRLGFGENTGAFGVELGYTYRVGDAPTGATLTEHKLAAFIRIDGFALGAAWLGGDSARYRGTGESRAERFQERTLRKGEYTNWLFTLGWSYR